MSRVQAGWVRVAVALAAVYGLMPLVLRIEGPLRLVAGAGVTLAAAAAIRPLRPSPDLGLPQRVRGWLLDLLVPAVGLAGVLALEAAGFSSGRTVLPWHLDLFLVVLPEELLFRRGLQAWLERRVPGPLAVVGSTTAFTGVHAYTYAGQPEVLPLIAGGGLVFGLLYWWRGRLWPGVAVHFLLNRL